MIAKYASFLCVGAALAAPQSAFAQVPTSAPAADLGARGKSTSATSQADTSSSTSLEEIVVTAQRRAESSQNVPIAVSTISAQQATARGLTDILTIANNVPSLKINVFGNSTNIFLRGVGSVGGDPNQEASVALYVDGVYIGSPIASLFDFNNIERIEVLKGPQGTLFGRNATAGVVQIITRDPSHTPYLQTSLGYSSYDTIDASAYVTGPLGANAAMDLAVIYSNQHDGFGRNLTLNTDSYKHKNYGARSKLKIDISDRTNILFAADYNKYQGTGADYQLAPGSVGLDGVTTNPGGYDTLNEFPDRSFMRQYGGSVRLDHDLGPVRFVNIAAYRKVKGRYLLDQDSGPSPLIGVDLHMYGRYITEEAQLISNTDSSISWLLGAFYYNARAGNDPGRISYLPAKPLPFLDIFANQDTESVAAYGQTSIKLTELTKATVGLRYTHERVEFDGSIRSGSVVVLPSIATRKTGFDKLTYRFGLDHKLSQDVLAYISYNRGIKTGGYSALAPTAPPYKPEILDAYEIGLKSEFLDRKLRLNLAAYYYDDKDLQIQVAVAGSTIPSNAARSKIRGFDVDFQYRPVKPLNITAGLGYTHGRYASYPGARIVSPNARVPAVPVDASGNVTINTPEWTGNLGLDYTIPSAVGEFVISSNAAYTSKAFAGPGNTLAYNANLLINGSVSWSRPGDRFGIRLWVRNLTNQTYYAIRNESVGYLDTKGPPRRVGVTLTAKF